MIFKSAEFHLQCFEQTSIRSIVTVFNDGFVVIIENDFTHGLINEKVFNNAMV